MNSFSVAEWMANELKKNKLLSQKYAVSYIRQYFGDEFVYLNKNAHLAINKNVLNSYPEIERFIEYRLIEA